MAILYEHPINERMRALLRIEDTIDRLRVHSAGEQAAQHHAAIMCVFELLELCNRSELKSEILQELERQRGYVNGYRNSEGVDPDALSRVLAEIEQCYSDLVSWQGKPGQHLRDNEWLTAVRSRSSIAGGMCEFDLPSLHAWLMSPCASRQADLAAWLAPFDPLDKGMRQVLNLLRNSQPARDIIATNGIYQQDLRTKPYQLMRVWVDESLNAVPEILANKYVAWVKFTVASTTQRGQYIERDVPFKLALCTF